MDNPIDERIATALRSYAVIAVLAVLLGAAVAPHAAGLVSGDEQYVAVVSIDEPIGDASAQDAIRELRALRGNDSVRAVVLHVSSPGGGAAASESMYMAVKRLAAEKPVYASVDGVAASGAYYTILPSDAIYVKPGSVVGHVGVIATAPSDGLRDVVASGPDKAHGGMTPEEFRASVETMKRAFVGSVMAERGDVIELDRTEVAKAKAFIGARAVRNGYADEIGGLEATIAAAAEDAGLEDYSVAYRNPTEAYGLLLYGGATSDASPNQTATRAATFGDRGVERVQFLMLYGVPEGHEVVYRAASPEVMADGA